MRAASSAVCKTHVKVACWKRPSSLELVSGLRSIYSACHRLNITQARSLDPHDACSITLGNYAQLADLIL